MKSAQDIARFVWPSLKRATPLALFLFALLVRLPALPSALPYTHAWDEPFIVNPAVRTIKTGDWNPHFQIYPAGTIYLQVAATTVAVLQATAKGELSYPAELMGGSDTKYLWTISHPQVYLNGRFLAAILGSLSVWVVWLIGSRIYNKPAGFIAAMLLALSPLAISLSTIIGTDSPATLFMLLAILFSTSIIAVPRARIYYVVAGISVGAAVAMKYNAGIVLLVPLIAHLLKPRALRSMVDPLLTIIVMAVTFLVISPYALLDYAEFMRGLVYNIRHYTFGSHNGHGLTTLQNLSMYLGELRSQGSSIIVFGFAVIGIFVGFRLRPRAHSLLLIFAFVYLWYFAGQKVRFSRLVLPVLPVYLLVACAPIAIIQAYFQKRKRSFAWPVVISLCLLLTSPVAWSAGKMVSQMSRVVDPRTQAMDYIRTQLPENAKIALEYNLHFYIPSNKPKNISELRLLSTPTTELIRQGIQYVVIPGEYKFISQDPVNIATQNALNARLTPFKTIKEFGSAPLEFGKLPTNSKIRICEVPSQPKDAPNQNGVAGLTMTTSGQAVPDFDSGALQLWGTGRFGANVILNQPVKKMMATMSGTYEDLSFPRIRITMNDVNSTTKTVVTNDFSVAGYNSYPTFTFDCKLDPGTYRLEVEYPNGMQADFLNVVKSRIFGVKYVRFE